MANRAHTSLAAGRRSLVIRHWALAILIRPLRLPFSSSLFSSTSSLPSTPPSPPPAASHPPSVPPPLHLDGRRGGRRGDDGFLDGLLHGRRRRRAAVAAPHEPQPHGAGILIHTDQLDVPAVRAEPGPHAL